jgi:hypothetical protein
MRARTFDSTGLEGSFYSVLPVDFLKFKWRARVTSAAAFVNQALILILETTPG